MSIQQTGDAGGIKPIKPTSPPATEQIQKQGQPVKSAPSKVRQDTIGRSNVPPPPARSSIVNDPLAFQAPTGVKGFQAVSPAQTYNMLMAISAYNDMFTSEAYEANSIMQGISSLSAYIQSFAEKIENWTVQVQYLQNQIQAEQLPSWEKWVSMGVQVLQGAALGFLIGGPAGMVIGAIGAGVNIALGTQWTANGESVFDRMCGGMTPAEAAFTKIGMSIAIGLVSGGAYAGVSSALAGFMSGAEDGITSSFVEEESALSSAVKPPTAESSTAPEEEVEMEEVSPTSETPEEIGTQEEKSITQEEESVSTEKESIKTEEKITAKESDEQVKETEKGQSTKPGSKPVDKTSSVFARARSIGINASISMLEGFSSKMKVETGSGSTATTVDQEENLIGELALAISGDKDNGLYAGITMFGGMALTIGGMVLGYAVSPAALVSEQSSIMTKIFSGLSFATTFAQSASSTANAYEQLKMVSQYRDLGTYTYDLGVSETDTTLGQTARQQLLDFMSTVSSQNIDFAESVQSLAQDVTAPIQKLYEG